MTKETPLWKCWIDFIWKRTNNHLMKKKPQFAVSMWAVGLFSDESVRAFSNTYTANHKLSHFCHPVGPVRLSPSRTSVASISQKPLKRLQHVQFGKNLRSNCASLLLVSQGLCEIRLSPVVTPPSSWVTLEYCKTISLFAACRPTGSAANLQRKSMPSVTRAEASGQNLWLLIRTSAAFWDRQWRFRLIASLLARSLCWIQKSKLPSVAS